MSITAAAIAAGPDCSKHRLHVLAPARTGDHTIAELAELFSVSRSTIYRELARARHDPA